VWRLGAFSVNCGAIAPIPITVATTKSTPTGRGAATMFWNVAFGDVITPIILDTKGQWRAVAGAGSVICMLLKEKKA
jgi:hypothetical protein